MQGNPEPKPMNEISETLTNVTAPPTNDMKSLQGMVRSLIGTVADQQDESEKLKHQIRQGHRARQQLHHISTACEKLEQLSKAMSRYQNMTKINKRLHREAQHEKLATDMTLTRTTAAAYKEYNETDEIYQQTADPGTSTNIGNGALNDAPLPDSTSELMKLAAANMMKSTGKSGMAPLNINFRPGATPAPNPNITRGQTFPTTASIQSMPLPPLPTSPPVAQQRNMRPISKKPIAPNAPSMTSLERMHLEIQLRAKSNGEPDYVNVTSPLDINRPVGGGMETPSPIPSDSFIGQMTYQYKKKLPVIPVPNMPPPPEPSYQSQATIPQMHRNFSSDHIYENAHSLHSTAKYPQMTDGVQQQIFNENLSVSGSHVTDLESISSYMTNSTISTVHTRSRVSSMTGTSITQTSQYDDSDETQSATSVVETVTTEQSRLCTRPERIDKNPDPVEIPESRATMNNFVNRIPSSIVRERFQKIAETLNTKWRCVNHELRNSDDQASALCKQMFALGLDILDTNGSVNLISTGRGMGDMGGALAAIKPVEASTINTFTKNILFTAIYINKQSNGNEMFQTSLQSLLETTDQLMDLLSQLFQSQKSSLNQPSSSAYSMSRTISDTMTTTQNTEDSSNSSDENDTSKADSLQRTMTNQSKQMDEFEKSLSKLEDKLSKSMDEIKLTPNEVKTMKQIDLDANKNKNDDDDSSNSSESFETSSESDSD